MKKKNEIIVQLIGKESTFLKFTKRGVYEFNENKPQYLRKIFSTNQRLTFRLMKVEIKQNQDYHFVVVIGLKNQNLEIAIEGRRNCQSIWKMMNNSIIIGLKDMIVSFRQIGEGAFSQIFEADTTYQTKIALKCFEKKNLYASAKNYEIFENQISLLKKLESRYIVSYDYLFETERGFYLKMEYFPFTLRQKLKSKKIMSHELKIIMKQMLQALIELKSKGIVHRDIKPANIMMRINEKTGEEECVLIDFGLATEENTSPYLFVRCGTPGYMSPEVSNAVDELSKISCASDMFSLGCVFYKMIEGKSLFIGKSPEAVHKLNKRCKYRPNCFQKLSNKQYSLLSSMLEKDPSLRITPQKALEHCYFDSDIDDFDEIPDEECSIQEKLRKILPTQQIKNMETICSSGDSFVLSIQEKAIMRFYTPNSSSLTTDISSKSQESFSELDQVNIGTSMIEKKKRRSRFSQQKNIQTMI